MYTSKGSEEGPTAAKQLRQGPEKVGEIHLVH